MKFITTIVLLSISSSLLSQYSIQQFADNRVDLFDQDYTHILDTRPHNGIITLSAYKGSEVMNLKDRINVGVFICSDDLTDCELYYYGYCFEEFNCFYEFDGTYITMFSRSYNGVFTDVLLYHLNIQNENISISYSIPIASGSFMWNIK